MKIFGLTIAEEIYMTVIIIVVAFILEKFLKAIIKKTFNPEKKHKRFDTRKVKTIRSLLCNVVKYVIWVLAILSLLSVYGVNTAALITGLGVVSLVVGLAFQDILKDILVGASILFENWYAVGDLVKIGDFTGTVTSIGLKATRVQAYTGEIKIISNRNITEVINYSLDKSMAVVDVHVSYETDIDKEINAAIGTSASPDIQASLAELKTKMLTDNAAQGQASGQDNLAQQKNELENE